MYMVEITEDKACDLYENIEKGLKYMGKAMQVVEEMKSNSYEKRGHRDYDEDDEEEMERFGERGGMRRNMRGKGRYSRY